MIATYKRVVPPATALPPIPAMETIRTSQSLAGTGNLACASVLTPEAEPTYVSVYSGPEPPSGGVSRPPLAVIAPHWTQFDGARVTVTVPSPPSVPISYTCAGHMCTHISAISFGTVRCRRM